MGTSRLHTDCQSLLNRICVDIAFCSLSNAFFERNTMSKQLIKCLLNTLPTQQRERVIARIIYSLIIGPPFSLAVKHCSDQCSTDENEILSVDLEWKKSDATNMNSDQILCECLM